MDVYTTVPAEKIQDLIVQLPAIITGEAADRHGIARGFASRVAWTFLSLVRPAFNEKGRGQTDSAGESWLPLSQRYLAYQKPKGGRGRPKAGGRWPGGRDGFMSKDQEDRWWQVYRQNLARLATKYDLDEAKGMAAAIATNQYKKAGGKVKLTDPGFGGRKAGSDYQTLVDRGHLRESLTPAEIVENGPDASYGAKQDQVFEHAAGQVLVGTSVPYARHHHHGSKSVHGPGRGQIKRRLWPENIPDDWTRQIRDVAAAGLKRIPELVRQGRI